MQGACNDDVAKLCKDVQPGEGRVLACLNSHQADVSKGCVKAIQQLKAQVKELSACEPDVETFCWNTPTGKGRILQCLQTNESNLSSADCKTALANVKKAKGKAVSPSVPN
jgi:Golgi apparatus protein 1